MKNPATTPSTPAPITATRAAADSAPRTGREAGGITAGARLVNLAAVVLPFLGLVAAVVFAWGWGLDWLYLWIFGVMSLVTGVGITVGYHRLFTHRSFETYAAVRVALALFGSMAVQGPLLTWVANHRRHHQHSDDHDDPHSPHAYGGGVAGVLRGAWHAHAGWLFRPEAPGLSRYVGDLLADRPLTRVSGLFPLWVALGLLMPAVLGGLITMTWTGALLGFIWGGLARVFFVHHVTWSINSVCHLWGTRPFRSHDESRNNPVFGVLALGEGWHNNHHAFPTSARHGLRWWEFDASYLLIRGLELLGLAWRVKVPTPAAINDKLR